MANNILKRYLVIIYVGRDLLGTIDKQFTMVSTSWENVSEFVRNTYPDRAFAVHDSWQW